MNARYLALTICSILTSQPLVFSAAADNDFLKYQEPQSQVSVLSNFYTILYFIAVFALILGLAYLTSKFVGNKMKPQSANMTGDTVIGSLSLGANKTLHLVQFAGRLLVLGVTEQKISLLADLTDSTDSEEIRESYLADGQPQKHSRFLSAFNQQLGSFRQMPNRYPRSFGKYEEKLSDSESEQEKR